MSHDMLTKMHIVFIYLVIDPFKSIGRRCEWSTLKGTNRLDCNAISTGAILLADILPTLLIKSCAPFFVHHIPYDIRVLIVVAFQVQAMQKLSFEK